MNTIFFTGVPGFLGSSLLPRVLARDPEATAVCVVQPRYVELARSRMAAQEQSQPGLRGRIRLVEGDITRPNLGIENLPAIAADITQIYHLAAVYDLSVGEDLGMRVNVDGTNHMLELARMSPRLKRFQYVSTCYVSGRYTGIFTESDLEKGQSFNNFYEKTKYLAEVRVRRAQSEGLPVTVYRPSVVVGDSHTGETQKYDGPYYVLRLLLRQPRLAVMPIFGDPTMTRFNVVPRNFVVDSIAYLSGLEKSLGKTYQLSDPSPLTPDEIIRAMATVTGRTLLRVPLPLGLAKLSLRYIPGVEQLIQVPASALDYFVHPTHYTCENTLADLAGSGISAPPFASYLSTMTTFVRDNPQIGAAAMV